MTLIEKVKKEAKECGQKLSPETIKGLKAIQSMHELIKQVKGSPSKIFSEQKEISFQKKQGVKHFFICLSFA